MQLSYATVKKTQRQVIHVLRIDNDLVSPSDAEDLAERLRERLSSRGEVSADVVVVQGNSKETLRLFGDSFAVSQVRAAMFNAALRWAPMQL